MPWPRIRFSVRQIMAAVAVVAILIPFPIDATVLLVLTFVGMWFPLLGIWALSDRVAKPLGSKSLGFAIICILTILLWASRNAVYLPWSAVVGWFGILSLANFAGPFVLTAKLLRREPPTSGEMLWSWTGLVWSASILGREFHGTWESLNWMADCARLSLVVTFLLVLYGKRPDPNKKSWAHDSGWLVMECDIITWGILASRFLWMRK